MSETMLMGEKEVMTISPVSTSFVAINQLMVPNLKLPRGKLQFNCHENLGKQFSRRQK
jgi:hypothetical protein